METRDISTRGGFFLLKSRRMTGLGMQLRFVIPPLGKLKQEDKSSRSAELFLARDPVSKNV